MSQTMGPQELLLIETEEMQKWGQLIKTLASGIDHLG